MHRPPRLGEQRRHMARRTARLPFEDALSSRSGALVVAVLRWLRRRQRKLVEVQRRQLRAHPVLSGSRMPDPGLGGQGKFVAVIEAAVEERSPAAHLRVGDVGVPVRHRAPARVGVEVYSRQPERGREQRGRRRAVWPERLPIDVELGIVFPWPPTEQDLLHRRDVHSELLRERREVWRQRGDGAHVEIPVWPAVEAAADALGELVVDGRVAQRASDSDAHEAVALVEPLHSDHRIVLEQIMRVLDVVEAEAHALEDVTERRRDGIEVDLEAELKRLPGRQALADASELLTRDRFVQAELVTPVGLTAEGLGTEDGAALLE